ncbi:unnamed protein product [Owenia fusiformis]|uniref:Uncharacterized protein n=1 Tax=Owenia fusiformis TaxID=6347 RepID=A0A8J1TPM8_OWEFU|nr:unnamed protein product [Owenia fusiformis]
MNPLMQPSVTNQQDLCNQTFSYGSSLAQPMFAEPYINHAFYCWFKFVAKPNQSVVVTINGASIGKYNHEHRRCERGSIRMIDGSSSADSGNILPDTVICGQFRHGQIKLKKVTYSHTAFVEFRSNKLRKHNSFDISVDFEDIDRIDMTPSPEYTFGDLKYQNGLVENSVCDWEIPVERCYGKCRIMSPGYPGIYPPNTRCKYKITNNEEQQRVELQLGGPYKFSLYKSHEPNDSCREDYVMIYDGATESSPFLGRLCGIGDAAHVISSGSHLLLVFNSGPGSPPWNYVGFDGRVNDRWASSHAGGIKMENTSCDWQFKSSDNNKEGDMHFPDYQLPTESTCLATFISLPKEIIEITVKVSHLRAECEEFVEINDGTRVVDKICEDRLAGRRKLDLTYNTTNAQFAVRYTNHGGQLSNPIPIWIEYKFISGEKNVRYHVAASNNKEKTTGVTSSSTINHASAPIVAVLYISFVYILMNQLIATFV